MKVCWLIISERNDLELQKNPVMKQAVIEKPKHANGKYLLPELYGAPKEMGIFYKMLNSKKESK
jgi:hypothetical protein